METKVIDLNQGTTVIPAGGTEVLGRPSTETGANFTGGLLQIHEKVADWEIESKLSTVSGEADIYLAAKDGAKAIVKYYRNITRPKTEILEKIKGLNHPDIVNVYGFGLYNSRFYEIMEYAAGGALDSRSEDGTPRYLPLPESEVEKICREVLNAFKACHEKGIIHRDIKPANIYFRNPGSDAVIADFGISSIMDEAEQLEQMHKTRTGSRTTGYAAPEVLSGIISPKMDYYALGITLWELLTGKDPFLLDNGKRRNDAHLIRDTIEGRIADDILSKEPPLSAKMQRLIRGLLVIDPDHRWGYDEVMRHLAGETVEVYAKAKKAWSRPFRVGSDECASLETLGLALIENPEDAKKSVFKGLLASFLEDYYPDTAKQIEQIADESSAAKDYDNGILKVAYLLNPGIPLKIDSDFQVQNIEDVVFLLDNAPEAVVPLLRNEKSKLYTWLDIMKYNDMKDEIKKLPGLRFPAVLGDAELAGKAAVIFKRKVIKPFKLAKYADLELSTLDQIRKIPKDMNATIRALIKERSYEGLFLPWFDLLCAEAGGGAQSPEVAELAVLRAS